VKFRIRFADQIVGVFVILGLASLVFVIVMLGKSQRWFARDYAFTTSFASAAGLSSSMAVQFRGFSIGSVKSFTLTQDNRVEVVFVIYENYLDRAKRGSLVEMMVSPIGLGNQFLFYPGKGEPLPDGAFIPSADSEEAKALIAGGLAEAPHRDDSVSLLLNRASALLDTVNTLAQGSVEPLTQDARALLGEITARAGELRPVLAHIEALTAKASAPGGAVSNALDGSGPVYTNLVSALKSVTGILQSLEKTSAFIPGQLPQIAALLQDLRVTLKTAEDVLTALTNNPLLRNGIPAKIESQPSGTGMRDVGF